MLACRVSAAATSGQAAVLGTAASLLKPLKIMALVRDMTFAWDRQDSTRDGNSSCQLQKEKQALEKQI